MTERSLSRCSWQPCPATRIYQRPRPRKTPMTLSSCAPAQKRLARLHAEIDRRAQGAPAAAPAADLIARDAAILPPSANAPLPSIGRPRPSTTIRPSQARERVKITPAIFEKACTVAPRRFTPSDGAKGKNQRHAVAHGLQPLPQSKGASPPFSISTRALICERAQTIADLERQASGNCQRTAPCDRHRDRNRSA